MTGLRRARCTYATHHTLAWLRGELTSVYLASNAMLLVIRLLGPDLPLGISRMIKVGPAGSDGLGNLKGLHKVAARGLD